MNNETDLDKDNIDYIMKLVLIGESGVGKTNILSRYIKGEFQENSTTTLGVEFASKIITTQDLSLRLQLWDTAGQERYEAVTSSF